MIINTIKGDALSYLMIGKFDVLLHGCNCFHTMGAGIAGQINDTLPEVLEMDKTTAYGDVNKLGDFSVATFNPPHEPSYKIVNGYTQFKPGPNFEYLALIKLLRNLRIYFKGSGSLIGIPKIGCGIGGGDWKIVEKIIEEHSSGLKIIIVEFND